MQILAAALTGLLFGIGILVSGMGDPSRVAGFFDVAGRWDPSLAFVMGGALAVTLPGYRLVLGRRSPLLAEELALPTATRVDLPLVAGSAVFGIGWGIAGFCPGAVLPMLATGYAAPLIFFAGLLAGLLIARKVRSGSSGSTHSRPAASTA